MKQLYRVKVILREAGRQFYGVNVILWETGKKINFNAALPGKVVPGRIIL
jgi:hypothetical protein